MMGRFRIAFAIFMLFMMIYVLLYPSWISDKIKVVYHIIPQKSGAEITCGEICSYKGKATPGKYYPYITKEVNCQNILSLMAKNQSQVVYPPPKFIPDATYKEFTQNGECTNGTWYFIDFKPNYKLVEKKISRKGIESLLDKDKKGHNINKYADNYLCRNTLHLYKKYISGGRGIVIGTLHPWLEAMLLNLNASHVTTSEYYPLSYDHLKLSAYHPIKLANQFISGQQKVFDFAASYSSIEHSGLGRFGDPLDPFGDLVALAQVWCMVKPGGVFFLGLPMNSRSNSCAIVFNAHRLYSYSRLQHVTANWEVMDIQKKKGSDVMIVLRKAPF